MRRIRRVLLCLAVLAVSGPASDAIAIERQHPCASVLIPPSYPVYGFGTPAPYPYGWFGVHYRTRKYDQRGYYGDYRQLGYWQGYW